jgi:hypothetical protein
MKETQVSGGWDKERRKLVIKTVVLTIIIMIFFELILAIIRGLEVWNAIIGIILRNLP